MTLVLVQPLHSTHNPNPDADLYYVYFKDKSACPQDVAQDFDPKAIARRARHGIAFPAWDDLPVDPGYCQAVSARVDSLRYRLRWFNAVTVSATPTQIDAVAALPFVAGVQPVNFWETRLAELPLPQDTTKLNRLYRSVRSLLHLDTLSSLGLDGRGVRVAVFDAGFSGVDFHGAFDHIRADNRIVATHDFYGGKGEDVYYGSGHGTAVLSCIGGQHTLLGPLGAATGAEFLLARTEHRMKEKPIEEDHWLAAMEWADQNGADIISSSLGYEKPRYTPQEMDGRTAPVSRAAAMAVRKGILVVNSAGNTGAGNFRVLAAPGDADSVLTVGGSYPNIRYPMPFSSYGPNARFVTKPEIAAPSYALCAHQNGKYSDFYGTSFSCPLVTGVAACLMQHAPGETNMEIREWLIQAGHTYPYFDYRMGYGVLDARYLFRPHDSVPPTFRLESVGDTLWVFPDSNITRKRNAMDNNGRPLSMSIMGKEGKLASYQILRVMPGQRRIPVPPPMRKLGRLRIWFEGYFWEEN